MKLWSEAPDLIKYVEENQPDVIMSASVNRTYLNLLLAHNRFPSFYKYTIALKKVLFSYFLHFNNNNDKNILNKFEVT